MEENEIKKYNIQDIIQIINEKRRNYITKYGEFPNTMKISPAILMYIKMQYLYIINEPLENIKTMFGMNIILDSHIDEPEEIKIYYKESEDNAMEVN